MVCIYIDTVNSCPAFNLQFACSIAQFVHEDMRTMAVSISMAVPTAVIFEILGLIILCGFAPKIHLLFTFFEVAVQMFSVPNTAEKKIELK